MPTCSTSPPQPFDLDKSLPILHLKVPYQELYVHQYPKGTRLPDSIWEGEFVSVTSTSEEVSVVARKTEGAKECGGPWVALRVVGPLEHHMVGVLAELARVLKDAEISIFTISTWDTDYILVTTGTLEAAQKALKADGWFFDE